MGTLAHSIRVDAAHRHAGFVALTYGTGVLKLLLAALALALVRPWGRRLPSRPLLALGWAAGAALTFYGVSGLVEKILIQTGAKHVPAGLGHHAVKWYLVLWEPVWILGGVLVLLAAWAAQRGRDTQTSAPPPSRFAA